LYYFLLIKNDKVNIMCAYLLLNQFSINTNLSENLQGVFDSHCHINSVNQETEQLIQSCMDAGMSGLISVCASPADLNSTISLSKKYLGFIYYTAGLHPLEAIKLDDSSFENYLKEIDSAINSNSPPLAIGEIGLDYVLIHQDEEVKRAIAQERFIDLIKISKKFTLPIVIHCRNAYRDVIDILSQNGCRKVVFHYFNDVGFTKEIIDKGWSVSLPITISKNKAKEIISTSGDLDNIMLETDSPIQLQERKITPLNLGELIQKISDGTGIKKEEIIEKTTKNVCSFFAIRL